MPNQNVRIETQGDILILHIPEATLEECGFNPIFITRATAQDLFGLLGRILQGQETKASDEQERIWP